MDGSLSTYNHTVRSENVNSALGVSNLMENTYYVFAQVTDWDTMSTGNTAARSFEYVHNLVHQSVGSGRAPITIGHMGTFSYSAFDPILRPICLWEAINPDPFLTSTENGLQAEHSQSQSTHPSVATPSPPSPPATAKPPTHPQQYIHNIPLPQPFGYSYPETQECLFSTPAALASNVTAAINTPYNTNSTFGPRYQHQHLPA
ncbi:Tyrosinase [Lachnellula arida]|uniref:Tyrosinase n=1 Tax=Lachnellula arida TaxID=1316785 RepID=A0A8T9BC26_9HELO|nr:Tyrosinase [Lachnellula arida]